MAEKPVAGDTGMSLGEEWAAPDCPKRQVWADVLRPVINEKRTENYISTTASL